MAKTRFFGTEIDTIYSSTIRYPDYRVYMWNPHRTSIEDIVLSQPTSPRYDITSHVTYLNFSENISFENRDDISFPAISMELVRDATATPIPIDETTLINSTPIQVVQGDTRVPVEDWVPIFTGVIRGNPSSRQFTRDKQPNTQIQVQVVGREENYGKTVITGRSYDRDTDVGTAVVETAIDFMKLNRREIDIGFQNYPIKHSKAQVVDIECLKGMAEMLFTVNKKPKFNSEGFLVAADADFDKPPARTYNNKDLIVNMVRRQISTQMVNSIKVLGLDDEMTAIVERDKRLAHGDTTAGWFRSKVVHRVYFSEDAQAREGGRKARETRMEFEFQGFGAMGGSLTWTPDIEADGFTVFSGTLEMDTGYAPEIQYILTGLYVSFVIAAAYFDGVAFWGGFFDLLRDFTMAAIVYAMQTMGHAQWEIHGKPFEFVYQQLCAVAEQEGVLTKDRIEQQIRNDWLYDIDYMKLVAKKQLTRELCKGWEYDIVMLDDPLLEVDDIIQVADPDGDMKFYITSIQKRVDRSSAPAGTMTLATWRIQ